MRKLLLVLLLLCSLVAPLQAGAANATLAVRDLAPGGSRTPAAARAGVSVDAVAVHWRGSGSVWFRTRRAGADWSRWRRFAADAAATAGRLRRSSLYWVGGAARVDYRVVGPVSRLRRFEIASPVHRVPLRRLSAAGAPPIISRLAWGADEKIVRGRPHIGPPIRLAIVHATAGGSPASPAASAAMVRAIQLYHVRGNGWDDIGYNFLVDRFGQIFEGRAGGIDKDVVGAHTRGFNTATTGVSVLGTYDRTGISAAARAAVESLLAWRLDLAHVDPLSLVSFISGGNARFAAGLPVTLRAVSSHRDADFTDDPGDAFYAQIPAIARRVAEIGLPKLYAPVVTGSVPGRVRFRARLSEPLDWTIEVADARGSAVASTGGFGQQIDWTWDATLAAPGGYAYAIRAGGATPAAGRIGAASGTGDLVGQLTLTGLAAAPATITPNGDGVADASEVSYSLSLPAMVTVTVQDSFGTEVVRLARAWRRAARHTVRLDGLELPDGRYRVSIEARATGGRIATSSVPVIVTRTLASLTADRRAFSPNGDGRADGVAFALRLQSAAEVRVRVLRGRKWVATLAKGRFEPGPHRLEWNGAKRLGRARDGEYEAVVEATDAFATTSLAAPFGLDTVAPRVRIVQRAPLRVWVSEPVRLSLRVGARSFKREVARPGESRVSAPRLGLIRIVAWDAAGNSGGPVSAR